MVGIQNLFAVSQFLYGAQISFNAIRLGACGAHADKYMLDNPRGVEALSLEVLLHGGGGSNSPVKGRS